MKRCIHLMYQFHNTRWDKHLSFFVQQIMPFLFFKYNMFDNIAVNTMTILIRTILIRTLLMT
jgi:hypothetical protein